MFDQYKTGAPADGQPGYERSVVALAGADGVLLSGSWFDVVAVPEVTAGAYSAGDVMGGLLAFEVAAVGGRPVVLQDIEVIFKAAVQPSLKAIIFSSAPQSTDLADNAAYSVDPVDAFKLRGVVPLSGYVSHGTPKSVRASNLAQPYRPGASSKNLFMAIVDDTGVTLTGSGDMQVRVAGFQV